MSLTIATHFGDDGTLSVSHHTASLTTTWTDGLAIITAVGEIDAANAADAGEHVMRAIARTKCLVLDTSQLSFFGTEGFSVLHRISVRSAELGVYWAMVPGPAVSRVLRICDPEGGLPAFGAVDEAIAAVRDVSRSPLSVVSG